MEIFVTNVKEIVVCKNNKKAAFYIKINVWIDQKTLQKGFFTIMNDCSREFLYVSFILPLVKWSETTETSGS